MAAVEAGPSVTPKTVVYCEVCSWPVEYCEFNPRAKKCKQWLMDKHPQAYERYYSDSAIAEKMANLSTRQREDIEKDITKKEAKATAKEEQAEKKRQASKVTIKRIERNKRKHITAVHGLDAFDIDLKKAAKLFANKFATGASVSKNNQGEDEITIQGDVTPEVREMLQDTNAKVAAILGGGKIPNENVVAVDESKKKKSAQAAAAS